MEYLVEGTKYSISYRELKESYINFCDKTDDEFINDLKSAIHLSCIICYFKEIPTYVCLSDKGIIHELVHLLDLRYDKHQLNHVRNLFREQLKLS